MVILTGVERVAINYNRPEQQWLDTVSLAQMKQYYQEGHFAEGSMGPKVLAAMRFVENSGSRAIITCLEKVLEALRGQTGTIIVA